MNNSSWATNYQSEHDAKANPAPASVYIDRGPSLITIWTVLGSLMLFILFLAQYPYALDWNSDWRFNGSYSDFQGELDMWKIQQRSPDEPREEDDAPFPKVWAQLLQKQQRDKVMAELRNPIRYPWETLVYLSPRGEN